MESRLSTLGANNEKKIKRKTTQVANSSSHQLGKRGHLGRKAPSLEKVRGVSEDQEGCGQTSQQTSPDWFEGGENAQGNSQPAKLPSFGGYSLASIETSTLQEKVFSQEV